MKKQQGRTLEIAVPRYFKPLLGNARYKGVYGGRASSKSHTIAEYIVAMCAMNQGLRVLCTREVQKSINQSVKKLIEDKIEKFGLSHMFKVRQSEIETPGGGLIMFQGLLAHTIDSIKSIEGVDICWIEEAQTVSQRSLDILRPTIFRRKGACIISSWNPRDPKDPIDQLLRANPPEDAIVVKANYMDNPFLPEITLEEVEYDRSRDMDKFRHVWLGEYLVQSEASIFKNWKKEYFETPADARFYYGLDFGYAKDPTFLTRSFIGRWEGDKVVADANGRCLFVDYEAVAYGCEIDKLPDLLDKVPEVRQWPMRCDNARPEVISWLQRNGYPRACSSKKGAGSIIDGIEFIRSYDVVIHERCKHLEDNFLHYKWQVDSKTEEILPKPEDKNCDGVDSLRYGIELLTRSQKHSGGISAFGPMIIGSDSSEPSTSFSGPMVII